MGAFPYWEARIPPPLAIPLAYAPPPSPGRGLPSFPPSSPVARIRPYTARPAHSLCDTLAFDARGYKRPIRQRKQGQRFPPLCYATQGNPTSDQKRPQRVRRRFTRPATRPSWSARPSAPLAPATGPPLPATGPPSLTTSTGPPGSSATGPPAQNTRFPPLARRFIPYFRRSRPDRPDRTRPVPASRRRLSSVVIPRHLAALPTDSPRGNPRLNPPHDSRRVAA